VIAARGELGIYDLQAGSLLVRKARLESELAGSENIAFPIELTARQDDGTLAILMQQEQLIFEARSEGLSAQVSVLMQLKGFLEKERLSLDAQLGLEDRQIELVQKELTGVSALVKKGLARSPTEMSLQRTLAEHQSARLGIETSLLRAQQEISRTDIAIVELHNRRINEAAVDLRETQTQLEEVVRRTDTAGRLLREVEFAPQLMAARRAVRAPPPRPTRLPKRAVPHCLQEGELRP
jgi:polysaccharide export outer membrane protein/exopolysaccharide production protein ExoF